MAQGLGRDAAFKIDDKTGTLVEITTDLTSIEFGGDKGVADVTTMGDNYKDYLGGIADATISIEGIYDPASGKGGSIVALHSAGSATSSISWEYYPQGTAAGKPKLSGECFQTSASLPSPLEDAVTFSAEYQNSGTVTITTV